MKPLVVLLATFVASALLLKILTNAYSFDLCGRMALTTMLIFTAVGHFLFARGMVMMVPDIVPFKTVLVYLTGLFEGAAAITIHIPSLRIITAWLLIAYFIVVFPAHVKAAARHIDYEKATHDGKGPEYLWFRVPLQLVFIAWAYLSAIQ